MLHKKKEGKVNTLTPPTVNVNAMLHKKTMSYILETGCVEVGGLGEAHVQLLRAAGDVVNNHIVRAALDRGMVVAGHGVFSFVAVVVVEVWRVSVRTCVRVLTDTPSGRRALHVHRSQGDGLSIGSVLLLGKVLVRVWIVIITAR